MDNHYLESRGWTRAAVDDSGMVDPFTGDRRNPERAEAMQRARDAAEDRAAWVKFATPILACPLPAGSLIGVEHPECVVAKVAGEAADAMLAEYRKRFRGEDLVPIAAPAKAAAAPRDTAPQDAATHAVREYLAGAGNNASAVFTAKDMCGALHITGPQFSAAKKALIKAGVAVDPGKGKISGKTAVAT